MLHYVVLGVAFMKYSSTIVYQQFTVRRFDVKGF